MSNLVIATDIPTNIDTVERLVAWGSVLLFDLNRGRFYKELDGDNGAVPLITSGIVEAADGTDRLITRIAIPYDPIFRTDKTQKIWMYAQEFAETEIPAAFKTN